MTPAKFYITCFCLLALLFCNCNKYPDGNNFSLNSAKTRLSGKWTVSTILTNMDTTYHWTGPYSYIGWCGCSADNYDLSKISMEFERSGKFKFKVGMWVDNSQTLFLFFSDFEGTGNWEFIEKKNKLRLTFDAWDKNGQHVDESLFSNLHVEEFDIIKLTNKEIRLRTTSGQAADIIFKDTNWY